MGNDNEPLLPVGGNDKALWPVGRPDEPEDWLIVAVAEAENGLGYGTARCSGMGESRSDSAILDLVENECFRGTIASHDDDVTVVEPSTGIPSVAGSTGTGTIGGTWGGVVLAVTCLLFGGGTSSCWEEEGTSWWWR